MRLIGTYVESPLCWAISVGKEANVTSVEDLKSKKFGISRVQSGSHLMAYVLANQRGWNEDLTFEVKGSFENLRNSVNDKSTDAFMWETFTTKPFHDSGEIKRIGEVYDTFCVLLNFIDYNSLAMFYDCNSQGNR